MKHPFGDHSKVRTKVNQQQGNPSCNLRLWPLNLEIDTRLDLDFSSILDLSGPEVYEI